MPEILFPPGGGGGGGAGGWTRTGTVVHLTALGDQVVIGAAGPVGIEKLRVVGDSLLEGDVFPDADCTRSIGTLDARWEFVIACNVISDDVGFTDADCVLCDEPFQPGDEIVLRARKIVQSEAGTRAVLTVPVHRECNST